MVSAKSCSAAGTEQRRAFYQQVEKEVNTGTELCVAGMCDPSGFSRAGYYRALKPVPKQMRDDLKLGRKLNRLFPWMIHCTVVCTNVVPLEGLTSSCIYFYLLDLLAF